MLFHHQIIFFSTISVPLFHHDCSTVPSSDVPLFLYQMLYTISIPLYDHQMFHCSAITFYCSIIRCSTVPPSDSTPLFHCSVVLLFHHDCSPVLPSAVTLLHHICATVPPSDVLLLNHQMLYYSTIR